MRDRGFEGIYLVAARAFDTGNPSDFGFDAAVEFPPHQTDSIAIDQTVTPINREFKGHVFDYAELSSRAGKVAYPEFTVFKTVMPSWDTEARKPGKGDSFAGAEPVTYANWLQDACTYTAGRRKEEQIIFVNAWNEWAEGAHVEPDRRFGYGFLHATANILRNYLVVETDEFIKQQNSQFRKTSVAVIVIHIFYEDLIDTLFSQYVQSVASICDVVVSVKADMPRASLKRIVDYCPNVYILSVPNIGRDIRPFILALRVVSDFGYVLGCKLHTKKSPHRADGDSWRDQMFDSLLGSKSVAQSTIYRFEQDPKLGVICPAASLTDLSEDRINAGNRMWLDKLLPKFGAQDLVGTYKTHFPAGSMYWFRTAAIDALLDHTFLDIDAFELEAGQLDGTLAHCIERLIPVVANRSGFTVEEI